jgi:hypothetical protein
MQGSDAWEEQVDGSRDAEVRSGRSARRGYFAMWWASLGLGARGRGAFNIAREFLHRQKLAVTKLIRNS